MAFRSHILRPFDMSRPSNRLAIGLVVIAAIAAGAVKLAGGSNEVLLAPLYTLVLWALARELDPDHDSTAIAAAVVGGIWTLAGLDLAGLALSGGLVVAARLVVHTTGRRPLPVDLVVVVAFAAAVSFSAIGWVAGFAIAVAIYVDDRMAEEQKAANGLAAALAALAASGVATLASVFPKQVPEVIPEIVMAVGALALVAVVREPEDPTSVVDSRRGTSLERGRLHAGRALVGVALFVAAALAGQGVEAVGPAAVGVAFALTSNEFERLRRQAR